MESSQISQELFSFDNISERDQHNILEATKQTFASRPDLLETIINDANVLLNFLPVFNTILFKTLRGIDQIISGATGADRIAALTTKFGENAHPSKFKDHAQELNIPKFAHVLSAILVGSQHALVEAWVKADLLTGLKGQVLKDLMEEEDSGDDNTFSSSREIFSKDDDEDSDDEPIRVKKHRTTKKKRKTRGGSRLSLDSSSCSRSDMEDIEGSQQQQQTNEHQSESSSSRTNKENHEPITSDLITRPSKQITNAEDQQPIPDDVTTKSRDKKSDINKKRRTRRNAKKLANNEIEKILTGHNASNPQNVKVILLYDIPTSWTLEKVLQELTLWGKVISLSSKSQHKYRTVRIKIELSTFKLAEWERFNPSVWQTDLGGISVRWYPASWTLEERKAREIHQASVSLAEDQKLEDFWDGTKMNPFLTDYGIKSFKIVKLADGSRKLLAFFETNEAKRLAIETPGTFNFKSFVFVAHSTPKLGFKASKHKTKSSLQPNQKNQKTKASSSAINKSQVTDHNGHASTHNKKGKTQKKDKKSKKSSGSNKIRDKNKVLAKITKLLGQLIN